MSGFWWYLAGFLTAGAITVGWYHGHLKPQFDTLKQMAEDKIKDKMNSPSS